MHYTALTCGFVPHYVALMETQTALSDVPLVIDFRTEPSRYRHWKIAVAGEVAELIMNVDPDGGLFPGYQLKLNSYDLGVDIELNDAIQRLRFEHPGVKVVILKSGQDKVFCAGANIRMLASSTQDERAVKVKSKK